MRRLAPSGQGNEMNTIVTTFQPPAPFISQLNHRFEGKNEGFDRVSNRTGEHYSVLVVEDNEDTAFMFKLILEEGGYAAVTVFSAAAALDTARSEHFDVVVSDIGMPGMNGYELARQLRALAHYSSTPIIAVTGFSNYYHHHEAISCGFNAYLTKPVAPTKLLEIVARLKP